MATFEEMQAAWTAQSAKIDQVNKQVAALVRLDGMSRVRKPLRGLIISLAIEIALCAVGMIVLGSFLADHLQELRFVWPPVVIDLWLLATLISAVRQMVLAASVNYDGPVVSVQGRLATLRTLRLQTFRWIFLTGQIVWWVPFLVTAFRMFFGVDIYRYLSPAFLVANMVAGLLLIPVLLFAAKRLAHEQKGLWYERLADVIAGYSLTKAQKQAGAMATFQSE